MGQQLRDDLARGGRSPDNAFLPASGVWTRYGVTSMTIFRWLRDEKLNFPKPVYIGRFRFWRVSELETFEAKQPRESAQLDNRRVQKVLDEKSPAAAA
jgi:predicted DNA-binding transcriptional regulator AlpA